MRYATVGVGASDGDVVDASCSAALEERGSRGSERYVGCGERAVEACGSRGRCRQHNGAGEPVQGRDSNRG